MIKFLDLKKINARFETEFQDKFIEFLNSGQYILGNEVALFEKEYANYCGTKYCVGVSSGLDALSLILDGYKQLGRLSEGDEVIVPANTFVATVLAIKKAGLKPVFVEPSLVDYNISTKEMEKSISEQTKAIIAVHLYGKLADMKEINTIASKYNLLVIEDAAQAHGAINGNRCKAGNLSNAAAFSFYPSKNLGALGDAGAITTNSESLNLVLRKLRNYGASSKYKFEILGGNTRLDEIQAYFLRLKLKFLDNDNLIRQDIAEKYLSGINNRKVKLPCYSGSENHVFYAFVVLVEDRADFKNYLFNEGVETMIHYPIPPHKQSALSEYNYLSLPITEHIHHNIISLPISPVMTAKEVERVIEVINNYS